MKATGSGVLEDLTFGATMELPEHLEDSPLKGPQILQKLQPSQYFDTLKSEKS